MASAFLESLLKGGLPEVIDLGRAAKPGNPQQNIERVGPLPATPLVQSGSTYTPYLIGGGVLVVVLVVVMAVKK